MNPSRLRSRTLLLLAGLIAGCRTEPIEPGWSTPPAQKLVMLSPADLGLEYETIEIAAPTGSLYGWFIPATGAAATVLFNHGSVTNRSTCFAHYVLLHELGYNVVVYDYRGFGESSDTASLTTLIPDANAVLAYLQDHPELTAGRIILFGFSLGTLPTLAQAARTPTGVIGVILEGSFELDFLPLWSYAPIGVVPSPDVVRSLYATYPQLDATQYVGRITLPKLFIHSPEDTITPLVGAERLFELAHEPKQWCEVYGSHGLSSFDPTYAECVATFIDSVVRGSNARESQQQIRSPQ